MVLEYQKEFLKGYFQVPQPELGNHHGCSIVLIAGAGCAYKGAEGGGPGGGGASSNPGTAANSPSDLRLDDVVRLSSADQTRMEILVEVNNYIYAQRMIRLKDRKSAVIVGHFVVELWRVIQ